MEKKIETTNNKYLYLEVIRIIACFFVVFNHTGDYGFSAFCKEPVGSVAFWIYMIPSVFCKFSVPIFFAISGALMLNRPEESLKKTWGRVLKIVIILAVFSLGYSAYDVYKSETAVFSLKNFLIALYSKKLKYHLWYLYQYIGYLIVLPFLKAIVKNLEDKYFYYMFGLAILFSGLIPTIEYLTNNGEYAMNAYLKPAWLLGNTVLYPCLGYFMHHRLDLDAIKKKLPILWGANAVAIAITCYMTHKKGVQMNVFSEAKSQDFHIYFVAINCVAIFLTIRYIFERIKVPRLCEKIILSLGACTFGIYLWHVFFRKHELFLTITEQFYDWGWNRLLVGFVMTFLVMLLSYITTFVMAQVPGLRKLVGFK